MGGVVDLVKDLGRSFDDMVRDVVPGGWATVGAATLLAVGITDPEILASAEEGTLTSTELAQAGVTAAEAQSAADIAAAFGSGYVPEGATYIGDQVYVNGVNIGSASEFGQTATELADGSWQYTNPDATWIQPATAAPVTAPAVATGTVEAIAPELTGVDAAMADVAASTAPTFVAPTAAATLPADLQAVVDNQFGGGGRIFEYGGQTYVETNSGVQSLDYLQSQAAQTSAGAGAAATTVPETVASESVAAAPTASVAPVAPTAPAAAGLPADVQAVVDQHFGGGGSTFEWEGQTWVNTANGPQSLDYLQQQADFFAQQAAGVPAGAIPTSGGGYMTADGQFYDAAGNAISNPYNVAGPATTTANYTAAQEAQYNELIKQGYTPAQATEMIGPVTDTAAKIDVTGAAGTAEAPTYATGPVSEGSQLATQAQIDSGVAKYNAASNAWEVASVPEVVVTAPALPTTGLTTAEMAGLGGAGVIASGGLGGGASAAGAVTPVAPTTAPATTAPATTTPATTTPVTPVAPTTAPASTLPPVVDVTPTPVAPPPPVAPPEIPPGPVPVVDAVPTVVDQPPAGITDEAAAAAAGYDAATIAKWVAAGLIAKKVVDSMIPTLPATSSPGTFTPATPGAQWQKPLSTGGLNPGWITATPYYQTTSPVQAQYYWGAHNPSMGTTNEWNTPIAAAPTTPWGIQQGPSPLNIQQLINSQLTNPVNQTPVAPVAPVATK